MTDPKKPAPSMKVAAATQKLSKQELEALLKDAAAQTSGEGDAEEDADGTPDNKAPPKKR